MADSHNVNHDYHIIDPSPWPLIGSIGALVMAIGGIAYMRGLEDREFLFAGFDLATATPIMLGLGLLVVLYTMYGWCG